MESWMISIALSVITFISTYAVLRDRHARLAEDVKENQKGNEEESRRAIEQHAKIHTDILASVNAAFKRIDSLSERLITLERDTANHLDMPKAEERFVSHKELQLHIHNIENNIKHMDKNVEHMSGKLDELTKLLSTNIVKTLSGDVR